MKNKLLQQSSCVSGKVTDSIRRSPQATFPFRLPLFQTLAFWQLIKIGAMSTLLWHKFWDGRSQKLSVIKQKEQDRFPCPLSPSSFWVTHITQTGPIYWSQNNLVYTGTWLQDSLQRMSTSDTGGFCHGYITLSSEPSNEHKLGLGLIISHQAIKIFSGINSISGWQKFFYPLILLGFYFTIHKLFNIHFL